MARKGKAAAKGGDYLTGHLLIAMPGMADLRFAQSVVCLCNHSAEGAMGLMLNRPIEGLGFDKLLRQLGLNRRMQMLDICELAEARAADIVGG